MFETLVITRKERSPMRRWLTLPLAAALHMAIGAAYLAAGLYTHETILPPVPKDVFAPPPVPVVLVNRREIEAREHRQQAGQQSATRQVLLAPSEPPTGIPPAPEPTGSESQSPDFSDQMVLPADGEATSPSNGLTGIAPTIPIYNLLTPPHLLDSVRPEYPPALRAMGLTGKVVFELVVDETGAVAEVKLVQTTHPLFTESAERAVRQWRYSRPLAPGGGQCRVSMVVTLRFTTG